MKKRIWELDAARGLALIGMILIHFVFDLTELTGILTWQEPGWFPTAAYTPPGIAIHQNK